MMNRGQVWAFVAVSVVVAAVVGGCPRPEPPSDDTLAWAVRAGGPSSDRCYAVSPRADGSCAAAGYFGGTAVFGAGDAAQTTMTAAGGRDVAVASYAEDGSLDWAAAAGGAGNDSAAAVAALANGGCYVTGTFEGTATFGPDEANETLLTSAGGSDVFLARYDETGTLVWAVRGGGTSDDAGCGVCAKADGSCIITGYYQGAAAFESVSGGKREADATGTDECMFIVPYSAAGEAASVATISGMGDFVGKAVASYSDGAFVVAGTYTCGDAEKGIGGVALKLSSTGDLAWMVTFDSAGEDSINGVAALGDGGCIAAGVLAGNALIEDATNDQTVDGIGGTDALLARISGTGAVTWVRVEGGAGDDCAYALSALSDGTCAVTGSFCGAATFGCGTADACDVDCEGEDDTFTARYSAAGALAAVYTSGGTLSDIGFGVGILGDGAMLTGGRFRGTATFGEGADNETSLTSPGHCDWFVARYDGE